ncbi:hypothetical protein ABID21_004639 [Pseudorhizobium tarimense]|uniref:Uncharacterized protein n=1 Tax=Pseudorhizobium tarimense TaxID=1079109 RepID=A0ABV2HD83_9HYPH
MSSRIRNLVFAFAMSLAMWAVAIHGAVMVYTAATSPGVDDTHTASVR